MSTSIKPGKGALSLYAETEGLEQPIEDYRRYQQELKDALDARQNRLFDPVLLAMAQGFLAPTKTGKFGEALGNVAAAVGPAQAAEEKRNIEMAQIRAELAAAELGQARKTESQKLLRDIVSGTPGQPTGGAPSQPPAGAPGQPAGATPGQPAAPATQLSRFTNDQLMKMVLSGDPDAKALATLELQLRKDRQDEAKSKYLVQSGGVFDTQTNTFTPFGGQDLVSRTIPGVGDLSVTRQDAIAIDDALTKGDPEALYKIVDKYQKGLPRPGQSSAAPGAAPGVRPAAPPVSQAPAAQLPDQKPEPPQLQTTVNGRIPVTVQEKEQLKQINDRLIEDYKSRLAIWQRQQEELGVGAAKRTGAAIEAGTIATAKEQVAKEIQQLIGTEGMNQYFGAFNKPNDIFSAIVLSVARAQESKSEGVDRSQIERVVSNLTLNLPKSPNETMEQFNERKKQVVERTTMAASRIAEMELYYSQLIKGQGQITEGEREILRRAAINPRYDSPRVILAKAKAIEAIASFEKWRANTLEENGITLAQLKRDPKYKFEEKENARIRAVNDALKPLLPKGQQPARSGGLSMDAINQRAESLGIKP